MAFLREPLRRASPAGEFLGLACAKRRGRQARRERRPSSGANAPPSPEGRQTSFVSPAGCHLPRRGRHGHGSKGLPLGEAVADRRLMRVACTEAVQGDKRAVPARKRAASPEGRQTSFVSPTGCHLPRGEGTQPTGSLGRERFDHTTFFCFFSFFRKKRRDAI